MVPAPRSLVVYPSTSHPIRNTDSATAYRPSAVGNELVASEGSAVSHAAIGSFAGRPLYSAAVNGGRLDFTAAPGRSGSTSFAARPSRADDVPLSPSAHDWLPQSHDNLSKAVENSIDHPGFTTVAVHGSPSHVYFEADATTPHATQGTDGTWYVQVSPAEFATQIRAAFGNKPLTPILLVSCETGRADGNFAQQLANELNVEVRAPSSIVWGRPNGHFYLAGRHPASRRADMTAPGQWWTFKPAPQAQDNQAAIAIDQWTGIGPRGKKRDFTQDTSATHGQNTRVPGSSPNQTPRVRPNLVDTNATGTASIYTALAGGSKFIPNLSPSGARVNADAVQAAHPLAAGQAPTPRWIQQVLGNPPGKQGVFVATSSQRATALMTQGRPIGSAYLVQASIGGKTEFVVAQSDGSAVQYRSYTSTTSEKWSSGATPNQTGLRATFGKPDAALIIYPLNHTSTLGSGPILNPLTSPERKTLLANLGNGTQTWAQLIASLGDKGPPTSPAPPMASNTQNTDADAAFSPFADSESNGSARPAPTVLDDYTKVREAPGKNGDVVQLRGADGKLVWFKSSTRPIQARDKVLGLLPTLPATAQTDAQAHLPEREVAASWLAHALIPNMALYASLATYRGKPGVMIDDAKGEAFAEVMFDVDVSSHGALKPQLADLQAFDYVIGNVDRHAENFNIEEMQKVWAIDNDLSFPTRPVAELYSKANVPKTWFNGLPAGYTSAFRDNLGRFTNQELIAQVRPYLEAVALAQLEDRLNELRADVIAKQGLPAAPLAETPYVGWAEESYADAHGGQHPDFARPGGTARSASPSANVNHGSTSPRSVQLGAGPTRRGQPVHGVDVNGSHVSFTFDAAISRPPAAHHGGRPSRTGPLLAESPSFFASTDLAASIAARAPPQRTSDGREMQDVGAHGQPSSVSVPGKGQLNAKDFAAELRGHPSFRPGVPVRLVACSTGAQSGNFAQQLANELGVTVWAPSEILVVSENGHLAIGSNAAGASRHGAFFEFQPHAGQDNSAGVRMQQWTNRKSPSDAQVVAMRGPGMQGHGAGGSKRVTLDGTSTEHLPLEEFGYLARAIEPGHAPTTSASPRPASPRPASPRPASPAPVEVAAPTPALAPLTPAPPTIPDSAVAVPTPIAATTVATTPAASPKSWHAHQPSFGRSLWTKTRRYMLISSRQDPRIDYDALKSDGAQVRSIHAMPSHRGAQRFFRAWGFKPMAFPDSPGMKGLIGMYGDRNHWEQQARYWASRATSIGLFSWSVDKAAKAHDVTSLLIPGYGYMISVFINTFYADRGQRHKDALTQILKDLENHRYDSADPARMAENEWIQNQFLPYAISQKNWQITRRLIGIVPVPFLSTYQFARGATNRIIKMYVRKNQGVVRKGMAGRLARELLTSDNPLAQDIVRALYDQKRMEVVRALGHKEATGAIYERINSTGTRKPGEQNPGDSSTSNQPGRCAQCAVAKATGISVDEITARTGRAPGADNAFELLQHFAEVPPRMALFASWQSAHTFLQSARPDTEFVITYRYRTQDAAGQNIIDAHSINVQNVNGEVRVTDAQLGRGRPGARSFTFTPGLENAPEAVRWTLDATTAVEVIPVTHLDQFTPPRSPSDVILNGEQLKHQGEQAAVMEAFAPAVGKAGVTWSDFTQAIAETFGLAQPVPTFDHRGEPSVRSRNVRASFRRGGSTEGSRASSDHLEALGDELFAALHEQLSTTHAASPSDAASTHSLDEFSYLAPMIAPGSRPTPAALAPLTPPAEISAAPSSSASVTESEPSTPTSAAESTTPTPVKSWRDFRASAGRKLWTKTRRYLLTSSRNDQRIDFEAIGLTDDRTNVFKLTGRAIQRSGVKIATKTRDAGRFVARIVTRRPKEAAALPAPPPAAPQSIHQMPDHRGAQAFFKQRGVSALAFSNHPGWKGVMGMRGDANHWEQQGRYWTSRGTALGLFPWAVDKAAAAGAVTDLLMPGIGYAISVPINTFYAERAKQNHDALQRILDEANRGKYDSEDPARTAENAWIIRQFLPYAVSQKEWQMSRRMLGLVPIPFLSTYQFARGATNRIYKMYIRRDQGAIRKAMASRLATELLTTNNPLAQDILVALYDQRRMEVVRALEHKAATGAIYERLNSTGTTRPSSSSVESDVARDGASQFGPKQILPTFDHRDVPSVRSRNVGPSVSMASSSNAAHIDGLAAELLEAIRTQDAANEPAAATRRNEAVIGTEPVTGSTRGASSTIESPAAPRSGAPRSMDRLASLVRPARMQPGAFRFQKPVSCGN